MKLRVVVLSGLSGSGKSTAIKALEDLGFFCLDNLPVVLLPKFLELCLASKGRITKVALVMDLREKDFLRPYVETFGQLRDEGRELELLFLEASEAALVRRFQETRRPHPLGQSLLEAIRLEREGLAGLKSMASWVLDTSEFTSHQLKRVIRERFGPLKDVEGMTTTLLSFGFRHGMPLEADLVMDVRFLPNPYFQPALKPMTGEDQQVIDYVLSAPQAKQFLEKLEGMMVFLIPLYQLEGKAYLTLAIGCTGGRHRSVTIANELGRFLEKKGWKIRVRHRDVNKGEEV